MDSQAIARSPLSGQQFDCEDSKQGCEERLSTRSADVAEVERMFTATGETTASRE